MKVLGGYRFGPEELLLSAAVGFLLMALYDVLRCWRRLCGRRGTAVGEILCGAVTGVGTFLLALVCSDGHLRVYQVAGEMLGATAYRLSVGWLTEQLCNLLRKGWERLHRLCGRVSARLRIVWRSRRKNRKNISKRLQK